MPFLSKESKFWRDDDWNIRETLRVGINEIFDRASVLTAHAHQARMSILEFCRLTKNGVHEQSILVTYFNH
jgi:hypothetical protein